MNIIVLELKIGKLNKKYHQVKEAIARLDEMEKVHLNCSAEDKDADYKYLYHALLQKQAVKQTVSKPSVRRVSQYK
jgi:hypothetical protein